MSDEEAGRSADAGGFDPVRDLFLGMAAHIDQLAALLSPGRASAAGAGGPTAESGQAEGLVEATGEVTSLLAELGDLLARLLAALIAVLEAAMRALQTSTPQSGPSGQVKYQAIDVSFSPKAEAASPESPAAPQTSDLDGELP